MNVLYKYGAKYNAGFYLLCGLSTDEKPIVTFEKMDIPNMSIFIEIDTGIKYYYDAVNREWVGNNIDLIPLLTYDGGVLQSHDGESIYTIR